MGINELLKLNGINSVAFFSEVPIGEKRSFDMTLKVPQETPNGRKMVECRVTFTALREEFFLRVDDLKAHMPDNPDSAGNDAGATGSAGMGR